MEIDPEKVISFRSAVEFEIGVDFEEIAVEVGRDREFDRQIGTSAGFDGDIAAPDDVELRNAPLVFGGAVPAGVVENDQGFGDGLSGPEVVAFFSEVADLSGDPGDLRREPDTGDFAQRSDLVGGMEQIVAVGQQQIGDDSGLFEILKQSGLGAGALGAFCCQYAPWSQGSSPETPRARMLRKLSPIM